MGHRFTLITVLTMLAAASPAAALDHLIDTGNDHWVEVTGEGSVNAAPSFPSVNVKTPTVSGGSAGDEIERWTVAEQAWRNRITDFFDEREVAAAPHGFVFFRRTAGSISIVAQLARHGYARYPVGPFVVYALRPAEG